MASYDLRNPIDYRFGQLSAGVLALDTTLTSAAFASLPAATLTQYIAVTLADDSLSLYETVWITGHTAGSTTVTVVRGREGSTARAWGGGTTWRLAPTARDTVPVVTSRAALPTDAHLGMRAVLADEGVVVEKGANGWGNTTVVPFGHMGLTDAFQSVAAANGAYLIASAAQTLRGGMTFDNANDALVVPISGLYRCTHKFYATGGSGYSFQSEAVVNSTALPPANANILVQGIQGKIGTADLTGTVSVVRPLAANDKVRLHSLGPNSTWGTSGYDGAWLELEYVGQ